MTGQGENDSAGDLAMGPAAPRVPLIDAARGGALLAMFVYHFAWDLGLFGYIALDVTADPAWRAFARAIAGSFLALVGASLVLADRTGLRARPFLRRLAMVGGAAALVTLGSYLVFPHAYIYFGILHAIAVSSVLALPFLRLPTWLAVMAAFFCFAAPSLFANPVFDAPHWHWLGLVTHLPQTNDYVPLLPWFGAVLTGLALARIALTAAPANALTRWRGEGRAGRLLVRMGRRSLAIYLLHQPVFLAALWLFAQAVPPGEAVQEERYMQSCEATCVQSGGEGAACATACRCLADRAREDGLWDPLVQGEMSAPQRGRIEELAAQCSPAVPRTPGD